jgi:hypothetical protein
MYGSLNYYLSKIFVFVFQIKMELQLLEMD